jgi:V/A-type H+-transporting ATPase subunit I
MSIVALHHVRFIGLISEKEKLLDDLHARGCLELIPLGIGASERVPDAVPSRSREALKFLLTYPQRRRQASDDRRFDPADVQHKALELQQRLQTLEAERDDLLLRLEAVKPLGMFQFRPLEQMADLRLWFYVVPHKQMAAVEATGLPWESVNRDGRFNYIAVLAKNEPESMPVPRVHVGSRSPDELAQRLEEVELSIEDAQAERAYLTRWCRLLARNLSQLEDNDARTEAAKQTSDRDPVFGLEGWVPQERTAELASYAQQHGLAFECRPPRPDENPPTLMRNASTVAVGEDLVNFYMTPGYWTWDPSGVVFMSFAVFFAIILADAGYAALLGVALLVFGRRLGRSETGARFRPLLVAIVLASLVYGVLVGSYFGITPSKDSFLGRLHVLDMSNARMMMGISILIGGIHVMLANVMEARRHANWRDGLASLGWAIAVGGGLLLGAGAALPTLAVLKFVGGFAIAAGLLLVVGFTAPQEKPLARLGQGLLGLTRVSAAFGDVLSYLRLFALGLASASLAVAFNDMAAGIQSGLPRIGLLLSLLVLAFGHTLNLLLGISSGVIHGLRLNVIEFFNWGLKDEGHRFRPFREKKDALWK